MSEMQSVLSESDKESLDVAMSMMGRAELNQVEDEVRKIQNNVRGWLLRKNYTNLRDAAKVLQVAWREKKRVTTSSNTYNYMLQHGQDRAREYGRVRIQQQGGLSLDSDTVDSSTDFSMSFCDTPTLGSSSTRPFDFADGGLGGHSSEHHQRELQAAATLQAATRAMIARRRSFSSVRKQTMASLVIQKSLVKWYVLSKTASAGGTGDSKTAAVVN